MSGHTNIVLSNPNKEILIRLVKKTIVSHDTRIFTFALPYKDHVLGLPIGRHILLIAEVSFPYTIHVLD